MTTILPDESWVEGCRDVLDLVLAERGRQVARYGLNEECEDGMGSQVKWLQHTSPWLHLLSADKIEEAFRAEYEQHEEDNGKPTWMHLIREELAEMFAEDSTREREAEAIQTAALLVSWVETSRRRRRG